MAQLLLEFKVKVRCYKGSMSGIMKYRMIALLLAATFCISNVGLPIVLASCPMIGKMQQCCPMCPDQSNSSTQKLTSTKNTSCCNTIIAGERNKTEFVQSQDSKRHFSEFNCIAPVFNTVNTEIPQTYRQLFTEVFSSPQLSHDIPIFTSSLLI